VIPEQQENAVGPANIELWFEFGSSYSYLSVMRIEQLAAGLGVTVQWRPFLLGPIFKSFGWSTSPFVVQTWKTEYVWRDMERECRKYGLAWTRPTAFPRTALLPHGWLSSARSNRGWGNLPAHHAGELRG